MAPEFRYAQLCPLARALEVVGERWTLLVVRELLLGPQRFSDLRRRLPGVSSSVLASRLERMEARGLVVRAELPPPAAVSVYELSAAGRALGPAVIELARWGTRYLLPPTPGDHLEPDWMRLALVTFARRGPSPERCFEVRVPDGEREIAVTVRGGPEGTAVTDGPADAAPDAALRLEPSALLGLMSGMLDPAEARRSGTLALEGDAAAAADFAALFEMDFGTVSGAGSSDDPRLQPKEN